MANDLLGRISDEVQERLQALRPVVDECERLQADLCALENDMGTVASTSIVHKALNVASEASAASESAPPAVALPVATPVSPAFSAPHPRPLISPKVLRLMGAAGARR